MDKEIIVKAPGRICLFGDHQDYLNLPVIACAINRHITLIANQNNKEKFVINMPDLGAERIINLKDMDTAVEIGDHLLAAIQVLKNYNCVPDKGYDITLSGNIAINAGTSSSSAIVVAWIKFLIAAFGCNTKPTDAFVSQMAYEAEVTFHGAPGGKMDQYAIGLGNIIYLETTEQSSYEIFDKQLTGLIVAESGIPKDTTGVLGDIKQKALRSIQQIKQQYPALCIADIRKEEISTYLQFIDDALKPYFEAAIRNHDITQRALKEIRKTEIEVLTIGALMNEHHAILRDYLNITVPKIDTMIEAALTHGALGAKIVGSGRGGSIAVLAKVEQQEQVLEGLIKAGAKKAYPVAVDPGARIVTAIKSL